MNLEAVVQRLEDIEEIKHLKHLYCFYGDSTEGKNQLSQLANLFVDGGVLEHDLGRFVGPKEIAAGLTSGSVPWRNVVHCCTNPKIEVDGDRATGTWYLVAPIVGYKAEDIIWQCGIYDEKYVRTTDGWKFEYVRLRLAINPPEFAAAYD